MITFEIINQIVSFDTWKSPTAPRNPSENSLPSELGIVSWSCSSSYSDEGLNPIGSRTDSRGELLLSAGKRRSVTLLFL